MTPKASMLLLVFALTLISSFQEAKQAVVNPSNLDTNGYVVVNFLFQLIFVFPLFWGMVIYANEFKTKEKQKLTEIKY